jgi:pimeloyl-ACP methyl ester carboxylesterase
MAIPLLFLHGIRGSRLCVGDDAQIIWQLSCEDHPDAHLIALHPDAAGGLSPTDPARPVRPFDLEADVYGRFTQAFQPRNLIAPAYDWRMNPARAFKSIRHLIPHEPMDIVTHSMGMNLLAWAVSTGEIQPSHIRRLIMVTPPFGGSLDILHVLLNGEDPEQSGDAATAYGRLVRAFPSLYCLIPRPGYGLIQNERHVELDFLQPESWPEEYLGEHHEYGSIFAKLLEGARSDREHLKTFEHILKESLADRSLIIQASGMPTPSNVELKPDGSMEGLAIDAHGDGRLSSAASLPSGGHDRVKIFGDPKRPVPHGDVLNLSPVLEAIQGFLD